MNPIKDTWRSHKDVILPVALTLAKSLLAHLEDRYLPISVNPGMPSSRQIHDPLGDRSRSDNSSDDAR